MYLEDIFEILKQEYFPHATPKKKLFECLNDSANVEMLFKKARFTELIENPRSRNMRIYEVQKTVLISSYHLGASVFQQKQACCAGSRRRPFPMQLYQ